jgi:MoxR-like ATPase
LRRTTVGASCSSTPRFTLDAVRRWQATVRDAAVPEALLRFAVALIRASHPDDPTAPEAVRRYVLYGSSPRGGQALILGAKALAALDGHPVSISHAQAIAPAALRHRLNLNFAGVSSGITADDVVDALLNAVDPEGC